MPGLLDSLTSLAIGVVLPLVAARSQRRALADPTEWSGGARVATLLGNAVFLAALGGAVLLVARAGGRAPADVGLAWSPPTARGQALFAGLLAAWTADLLWRLRSAPARAAARERWRRELPFLPRRVRELPAGLLASAAAAFGEELAFRGHLLADLQRATGSPALAVAGSSLAFAAGHVYQGAGGVARVAVGGVVLALLAQGEGDLGLALLAHFVVDVAGCVASVVLLPDEDGDG